MSNILKHNRQSKRYNNYAKRVFYKALKTAVTPLIQNKGGELNPVPMQQAFYQVYIYVGTDAAKVEYERLRKQEPVKDLGLDLLVNSWAQWMRTFVAQSLGKRIQDINANTQRAVNKALQDGLEAGETDKEIQDRIYNQTLGLIGRNRAALIGRTETTNASNTGKLKSAKDWALPQGVDLYKKWLNTDRPTERRTHQDEDNKPPIPVNERFQVFNPNGGVDYMMHPGDQIAGADQVCNCNCTVVYMSKRYAERNYNLYA